MAQLIVNGLSAGLTWALVALGFSLVASVGRFFHFAHGAVFTIGAYLTFLLASQFGLPLSLSIPLAVGLSGILGCLMELCVYRPLRRKGASPLILLLASLGMYIVLENVVSLAFGNEVRVIRLSQVEEGITIAGGRLSPPQILVVCASVVLVTAVSLLMGKTAAGRRMRAVASDPHLARVSGIDSDRVILWTLGLGSALAASAGILVALDVGMVPTMGTNALLMGVAVTIVGGIGSIPGAAMGGLLLGLVQHLGTCKIGPQWQDAIAFGILLMFLLLRPCGILGRKLRKAEI